MAKSSELVRFQKELRDDEQLILAMLSKIDTQLHALQVEQLELLSVTNSSKVKTSIITQNNSLENSNAENISTPAYENVKKEKELDLDVPLTWQDSECDEEDSS